MILCQRTCPERSETCHSTCQTYLQKKIIHELRRLKRRKETEEAAFYREEHDAVYRRNSRNRRDKDRRRA